MFLNKWQAPLGTDVCQYRFGSYTFATIFWRAVLCHRQGLCGADGAAPSTFGCGTSSVSRGSAWERLSFMSRLGGSLALQ